MTKTMKAVVIREFGKPLIIEEVPVPTVGAGQILVKIAATGLCHTDLHAVDGDWPVKPKPPFIPGHECAGHVAAVGTGVRHVKEGARVGVPWLYTACGHCKHCLGGWETLRNEQQNTGYSVNGSFAEYVAAAPNYGGHFPDNVGFGHLAVQYTMAMGLNVIAFVKQEVGCAQGVLVTAISPKAFEHALGMVGRGGMASLNGLPPGDFPLSIFDTALNGVTVRGSPFRKRRVSPQMARSRRGSRRIRSKTSTTSLRACITATSRDASCPISRDSRHGLPDRLRSGFTITTATGACKAIGESTCMLWS